MENKWPIIPRSTSKDKVFIYFTDHGANGLIGFPDDIVGFWGKFP